MGYSHKLFAICACALLLGQSAFAVNRFQCGISQVTGKIYASGIREKAGPARDSIDKKKVRAPLLVLWENSLSETVIPLAVSAYQKEELSNLGDGVVAEVDIEVEQAATKPDFAKLVSFRMPASTALTDRSMAMKVLKPLPCGKKE